MKTKLLALAFIALAPFAASADDLSYNYFDISYQFGGSIDVGPSIDTTGFVLRTSYAIDDTWFASFDYASLSSDPSGISPKDYTLSGGWRNDMFFAKLGYEKLDIIGLSDSGYSLDLGARGMVSDGVELNGHVGHSDLGNWGTFTSYGFGGVWSFGDDMGISFNYDIRSGSGIDFTSYGVGFRMNFN